MNADERRFTEPPRAIEVNRTCQSRNQASRFAAWRFFVLLGVAVKVKAASASRR
jgi:hypothetical protein